MKWMASKISSRELTLQEVFRHSNDIMFFCDENAVITDVNEAFVKTYGYSRAEAIGQTPRIVRSRHTTNEFYKIMWSSINDPKQGYWRGEIINRAKDGREIPLILTITAVRDEEDNIVGYVSNGLDMREQVAMRGKLAQNEALASLGEMAAVVAHEIRNPLGSIVMAAKQLSTQELSSEDREIVLDVLRRESQRLNGVLSNFLAYARPRELKLSPVDINTVAEDISRMVQSHPEIISGIKMEVALDKKIAPIPLDSDQIRQVAWNIVLNALQSMKGKGKLKISTGRRDSCVYLSVEDNGPGVASEAIKDIFKPFFTTKQQGTGLGLAIADRIVKAHGGNIEVQSIPNQGACFRVCLPAAK